MIIGELPLIVTGLQNIQLIHSMTIRKFYLVWPVTIRIETVKISCITQLAIQCRYLTYRFYCTPSTNPLFSFDIYKKCMSLIPIQFAFLSEIRDCAFVLILFSCNYSSVNLDTTWSITKENGNRYYFSNEIL